MKFETPCKLHYRNDLDGLRAVAVLAVIFFHFRLPWTQYGFLGVDVFFVLSGFLITGSIHRDFLKEKFSFLRFYRRRALRLMPAVSVVVFFTMIVAVLLMSPDHLVAVNNSVLPSMFYFSNTHFWSNISYFSESVYTMPLLHTWSLGVEEQFYFIFPIIAVSVFIFVKNKTALFVIFLLMSVCFALLNILFLNSSLLETSDLHNVNAALAERLTDKNSIVFYMTPFRMYQFIAGSVVYFLSHRWESFAPKLFKPYIVTALRYILITLLVMLFFGFGKYAPFLFPEMWVAVITPLIILIQTPNIILQNRVFIWIGSISYSLYLVHWPVLVFYDYYTLNSFSVVDIIVMSLFILGAATLLYKYVEVKFREG